MGSVQDLPLFNLLPQSKQQQPLIKIKIYDLWQILYVVFCNAQLLIYYLLALPL